MSDAPAKKPSSSPAAIGLSFALVVLLGLGMRGCMTQTHSAPAAPQAAQTLNTAQLAQQAVPVAQSVASGPVDIPSARTGSILCAPMTAVGLGRFFIPKDANCPRIHSTGTPAPGITPLDEDSPTGIQQAQGVGETDHEHPDADVNWGHPVQAYRYSEMVPTDALPSADGYHAECWDMARRTYVNLEKEACTPKEAGGYRFQCPAGQTTCEIPYIWRTHTS